MTDHRARHQEKGHMMDRPTTVDRSQLYRATFDRYVASTDGKEKLARSPRRSWPASPRRCRMGGWR